MPMESLKSEPYPVMCILQFFAQAGYPCQPLRNPSDHLLRCINADFDKVKATLKGSMKMRVSFRVLPDPWYYLAVICVLTETFASLCIHSLRGLTIPSSEPQLPKQSEGCSAITSAHSTTLWRGRKSMRWHGL